MRLTFVPDLLPRINSLRDIEMISTVSLRDKKHTGNSRFKKKYKKSFRDTWTLEIPFNKQVVTNSMAYGTRRFNIAFTRALQ